MNIERLKVLVRGILDADEALEAMRILSDSQSYTELRDENAKLKKQLQEESEDHAKMENALARARLRAEGERDVALLASARISEEEFLKRVDARWQGKSVEAIPDDALNPMGKMFMKMGQRIKEQEILLKGKDVQIGNLEQKYAERDRVVCEQNSYIQQLQRDRAEKGKPESQIQAELLADMMRLNEDIKPPAYSLIREVLIVAARRNNIFNQMMQLLMKTESSL